MFIYFLINTNNTNIGNIDIDRQQHFLFPAKLNLKW